MRKGEKRKDCVYYYYFQETNSIYVGRTVDKKGTHYRHRNKIKKDTVAKYAYENGFEVPEMVIIEDNLTVEQGQKQEGFWVNFYVEHGYNILNIAPTGSIGNIDGGLWTYEKWCDDVKNYKTKNDLRFNNQAAYIAGHKHGWINSYNFDCGKSIPIVQYTKNGDLVKIWDSAKDASINLKIYAGNIAEVCKGKRKTYKGFVWRYYGDDFNKYNSKTKHHSVKVIQYDLCGNFLSSWVSAKEAGLNNNIPPSHITMCCKGKIKTTHNFIFKYA